MRPRLATDFTPDHTLSDLTALKAAGIDGGVISARQWHREAADRLTVLRQQAWSLGFSLIAVRHDEPSLDFSRLRALAEAVRCRTVISPAPLPSLIEAGFHVSLVTTTLDKFPTDQSRHLVLSADELFPGDKHLPYLTSLDTPIRADEKFLLHSIQQPLLEWLIFPSIDLTDPLTLASLKQAHYYLTARAQKNAKSHCRAGACP